MRLTKIFLSVSLAISLGLAEPKNAIEINFKDLEIEDFVKMVAKITDKNILLSQDIRGKINFVSVKPIPKERLYSLLQQILDTKGFTLIEHSGGFLNIVRSSEASKENLPVNRGSNVSQMYTEIIKVENENVDIVASKIRHLLSKSAKLVTSKEINSIIISDFPNNINTIKEVIKEIVDIENTEVEFVHLEHTKSKSILGHIIKISQSIFNQKIDEERMTILNDDATNSLILISKAENIKRLKPYIEQIDKKDNEVEQKIEIFPLKNSETKEVLKVVNTILSKKVYQAGDIKPTVTSDDSLNAIVAMGVKSDIDEISELVKNLDKERQQVYVKAKIIEISDNKWNEFGMKYGLVTTPFLSGSSLFSLGTILSSTDVAGQALQSMQSIPGFNIEDILPTETETKYTQSTETQVLENGTSITSPVTVESKETVSVAPDFALAASLSLLDSAGATNRVSEPSILCINNEESSIYVGETRRVQTGSVVGTTTQNLTKVEDVGLTLKIKPRLSNDNKVLLQITSKLEDIIPGSNQDGTTKREVTTKAIVKNGESVIIGGLIKDSFAGGEDKVPLLGDIPIVGDLLFKHTTKKHDKINLVIILTPYIIDTSDDLTEFKAKLAQLNRLEEIYAENVKEILGVKDEPKSDSFNDESIDSDGLENDSRFDIITPDFN